QWILHLNETPSLQIDLEMHPEIALKKTPLPCIRLAPRINRSPARPHEAADGVISPYVQNQALGSMLSALMPYHPTVGLINTVAADAIVPYGLAKVTPEILLPSLAVTDLIALRKAISVTVDTGPHIRISDARAGAVWLECLHGARAVYAPAHARV